jgi:hypothetical protein
MSEGRPGAMRLGETRFLCLISRPGRYLETRDGNGAEINDKR